MPQQLGGGTPMAWSEARLTLDEMRKTEKRCRHA